MSLTYTEPLLLLFLAIAFISLLRTSKSGRKTGALLGLLGLFLISWPPAEWLLSRPLESRYPVRPFRSAESPQVIVVLSGGAEPPEYERPYPIAGKDTYERCLYAAWIFRNHGPVPVLASGGTARYGPPLSVTMREVLKQAGVPENLIWTEERSHNTYENALYSSEILRRQAVTRIALVVEARSMRRAEACFRRFGFTVIPSPSGFRTFGPLGDEIIPNWKAIQGNELTLHETLGLAWYWLRGWI